jgi:hypothetical protein
MPETKNLMPVAAESSGQEGALLAGVPGGVP